jgi:hypothetical protein
MFLVVHKFNEMTTIESNGPMERHMVTWELLISLLLFEI